MAEFFRPSMFINFLLIYGNPNDSFKGEGIEERTAILGIAESLI